MYVGTLTVDEMSFAGATGSINYTHYLMNNYAKSNTWWCLSPAYYSSIGVDYSYVVSARGQLSAMTPQESSIFSSRPVIILKSGIQISAGNGTISDPYKVN